MTPLETAFAGRAVYRGGLVLYNQATALDLLIAHREAHEPLVGLDAFWLSSETTQPLMQHSLDISSTSFVGNPFDAMRQVIQQSPAGTYFEFISL